PTHLHSFPTRRSSDLCRPTICVTLVPKDLNQPLVRQRHRRTRQAAGSFRQHRFAIGDGGPALAPQACPTLQCVFPTACNLTKERSEEHTSELQSPDHL